MGSRTIDDSDPSVVYSTGWYNGGAAGEFDSTTTFTRKAGANATLTFLGVHIDGVCVSA
jgi:hypothetical protein